jgi:hypothetical protein
MENQKSESPPSTSNDNTRAWVFVIGILLIIAITAIALVVIVQQTIQKTVDPVQSMTGSMATQVAQFMNPTPTVLPDPITIIRDVRSLSRLETIQYSVEKVITAEVNQGTFGPLFGDKLIFIARGEVLAGIDLAKLSPEDMEVRNGVLYVSLPKPEVFIASVDNEKSYVYDRSTGLLSKGNIDLETQARRVAEAEIEKAALEDGILDLAYVNAENFLYRFFRELGYQEVVFQNRPSPKLTATPTVAP